jgi:hypothetical protein
VKASEVAAITDAVYQQADSQPVTDELRAQVAERLRAIHLTSVTAHAGSLQRDPQNPSAYYMAADANDGPRPVPLLLYLGLSSDPPAALFRDPMIVGRVRPGGAREIVVTAVPFSPGDRDNVKTYADRIDPAILPRPQGPEPAIAAGNRHPEISLPAVFEGFREVYRETGLNLASTVQLSATREMTTDDAIASRDGENPMAAGHTRVSIRHLYHAGLWAAIRAGWREGYNAEADHFIVTGNTVDEIARSVESAKEAIHHAAGYTKFTTDTSRMFELRADERHASAWTDSVIEERFEEVLSPAHRSWVLGEFSTPVRAGESTYAFTDSEIRRLAVKFGASLLLNEELYDAIRKEKAGEPFDFEPSLDEAETLTTAKELIFYMHWLKARGRPAQLVPPNLGFKKRQAYPDNFQALEKYSAHKLWPELLPRVAAEFDGSPIAELSARIRELAGVARHFDGTLSIHSGSGKQPRVLNEIGRATSGRFNYKISGELQLQLFDVLSEQPEGSYWRNLFDRMVARCNHFAERGAFGEESALAREYPGSSLGSTPRGRVDGNLFLVFWLGNVVGSRDIESRDGDARFFADKLKELPADLLQQVQHRNKAYIVWLAEHLRA